jgi:hypothetical protein
MSTSRVSRDVAFWHADYELLVTGRSLNALEPEEDERLFVHLRMCAPCRLALALFEEVAAELGRATRTITPSPILWRAVASSAGGASLPAQPSPDSGTASRFPGPGGSA